MTATMRAARFDGTGLSVQDVPVPVPGPSEVLVEQLTSKRGDPVRLVVQPWA